MTSQFKSIIEKIKTDKNVQVAVASIAAATVLVIGGTTYYISQTHSQTEGQTYKKVASVGSEKYEKVRKDDASDVKIDDKLVESISSATSSASNASSTSSTSSSSNNSSSSSSNSSNSQTTATQSNQSNDTSSNVRDTSVNSEDDSKETTAESDIGKEDSLKKKESKTKVVEISSNRRNVRSKRSEDQSDWDDGKPERRKSEEVSGDNWNDEDSVEELNLHR